jgi:hypothetical protein
VGLPVALVMSESASNETSSVGPSYYARPRLLRRQWLQDWWTVLHPPYTMLHLSLVTIGACLVGPVNSNRLLLTLAAFFLAIGIGAHSLDELNGRPLKTSIPTWQLVTASVVGVGGAVGLGVIGLFQVSFYLAIFIAVGAFIAVAYNLELFHGRLHTNIVLVLGWGAFPVLTAYYAQHDRLGVAVFVAAAFGALVTQIQRLLSTPARDLRRRTASVEGTFVRTDGSVVEVTRQMLLRPLEQSLRTLCWAGASLALALAYVRLR